METKLTCTKSQPCHCFLPIYRAWDAAILCTSPTANLATGKWGLAWYWVWMHSREEFSHTLPGNRFIATYPHTVPNSPKSLLMFYFNCSFQPADDKPVLSLQWRFEGRDWMRFYWYYCKRSFLSFLGKYILFFSLYQRSFRANLPAFLSADCCISSQQNTACWLEPSAPPACTGNQTAGNLC